MKQAEKWQLWFAGIAVLISLPAAFVAICDLMNRNGPTEVAVPNTQGVQIRVDVSLRRQSFRVPRGGPHLDDISDGMKVLQLLNHGERDPISNVVLPAVFVCDEYAELEVRNLSVDPIVLRS